ncbi:MAG: hypothetical protein AAGC57_00295 [Pseudomonadota bacterium]
MKWLVDIDAMVAEGVLSEEQGKTLRARAGAEALGLGVGILLIGGILTVMAGLLAFFPTPQGLLSLGVIVGVAGAVALLSLDGRFRLPANAAAVIGCAAATAGAVGVAIEGSDDSGPAIWIGGAIFAGGLGLHLVGPNVLRVAAAWIAVIGGAAHLGGVFGLDGSPERAWLAMLDAAVVLLLAGALLDLRILTAFGITALAGLLAATAYTHAAYWLAIWEPSLLILLMAVIAVLGWWIARGPERWARHGRIAALMALIWINMAFWIGSLWGDRIGEHSFGPVRAEFAADEAGREAFRTARDQYLDGLIIIPADVFAVGWAALILITAAWASLTNRRSVLNAAATFGAIHLYTQWFERLETQPLTIVAAGVSAIGLAWAMVRLNAWMRERMV